MQIEDSANSKHAVSVYFRAQSSGQFVPLCLNCRVRYGSFIVSCCFVIQADKIIKSAVNSDPDQLVNQMKLRHRRSSLWSTEVIQTAHQKTKNRVT